MRYTRGWNVLERDAESNRLNAGVMQMRRES